jgi:type IV pilus assembly protein PilY1
MTEGTHMATTRIRLLLRTLLLALLAWLASCRAGPASAAPPPLEIASEPILAGCVAAGGGPPVRGMPLVLPATAGAGADAATFTAFQASYGRADWSGHFERYAVQADSVAVLAAAAPVWDAGVILTGTAGNPPRPAPSARNIYTAVAHADGTLTTAPFAWDALSGAQRAMLDRAPGAGARSRFDGMGRQRMDYLRGERTLEGSLFRRRGSVLGDAVNSTPVYVGVAPARERGAAYAAFYARSKVRRPAIYLGANDGMLHGFDAADGSELFAYVPDALFGTLNRLTSPAYVHTAYVDGPASAGEAYAGGAWKTVLVSGMGGGAQGVFALDVTDPLHFDAAGALWEFTDRDDPMMGNVATRPQVARVRTGGSGGAAVLRDMAIVASGWNNYAADGHASSDGNGALFLLALDKPPSQPWRRNDNYYRLVTPISDPARPNGLSAPALVSDADGVLRYAYAGDLQGNLWRFDLSGDAPWPGAVGPGPGKTPLFVARDAGGARQAIAQQPKVVFATGGGYLILFGTGRMLEADDRLPARFAPQSYYAILDTLATPAQLVEGRGDLTPRSLSGADGAPALTLTGTELSAGSKGWYIDFLDAAATGERSLDSGVLTDGQLALNTVLPGRTPCDATRSRSYVLDALTGLPSASMTAGASGGAGGGSAGGGAGGGSSGGGGAAAADSRMTGRLAPDYAVRPVLLRLPAALPVRGAAPGGAPAGPAPGSSTSATVARASRTVAIAVFSALGTTPVRSGGSLSVAAPSGRLSWREVVNWRELHAAARR